MALGALFAQEAGKKSSSYSPVVIQEDFATVMARMSAAKPAIIERQKALLEERYDLSDRPARGVTMSRGKVVQEGVRVKLRAGMTWDRLAQMRPEEIRDRDVFPLGFMPLPHPNHPEGGMLFPKYHIAEIEKQEGRDLKRFSNRTARANSVFRQGKVRVVSSSAVLYRQHHAQFATRVQISCLTPFCALRTLGIAQL